MGEMLSIDDDCGDVGADLFFSLAKAENNDFLGGLETVEVGGTKGGDVCFDWCGAVVGFSLSELDLLTVLVDLGKELDILESIVEAATPVELNSEVL
ncbi:hypothetical protein WICMUC_003567 [Wickerhamomyces mucosus]|uniref:Uncharacterized protein n=1 Tax=Wickerhamomyces mucosus TaxID=1378264 RepID=A0A9P8PLX3_9ASCO|nr:hypothetical protein WICMUC_003567 [Wickerhamomyces mucosus]